MHDDTDDRAEADKEIPLHEQHEQEAVVDDLDRLDAIVAHQPQRQKHWAKLVLGVIGVVYGDIGTSPLYALKEGFFGHHPLKADMLHIFGFISLIFWTMTCIVTIKYVVFIMRADNRGEGGCLALLALITRTTGSDRRWSMGIILLGVFATSLFFGDSIITPAMSVLSAVEGLIVVEQSLAPLVLPLAVLILIGLFVVQARGTAVLGALFGPIVLVYFLVLALLGVINIWQQPAVLQALSPVWAVRFMLTDGYLAFLALGSVVLAVTGAEALYADMGHFGRRPIVLSWLYLVFPCLLLNYLGQGALLISDPTAVRNPFFLMAPEWARLPLVLLATCATIIASQAVISGAFSVARQAMQLGFLPRIRIAHTSASSMGQIYIPALNWILLILVIMVVLLFRSSTNLAGAYGIAVTGTMFITTVMLGIVMWKVWKWRFWHAAGVVSVFFVVDTAYLSSNLTKVGEGGWFPLLIGVIAFTLLTTWSRGRGLMTRRQEESAMPVRIFIKSARAQAACVPGTAVFLTSSPEGVPPALLHNMKHNKVLHERVILLTVIVEDIPYADKDDRLEIANLGNGFFRICLHYGFMEEADVPAALGSIRQCGPPIRPMETSFFLARQTLLPAENPGMSLWREKLFSWMLRNSESAMSYFKLPPNRVVELGSQVEI